MLAPLVIVFLVVFHFIAMYLAGRRLRAMHIEILKLRGQFKQEQHLTTHLREELTRRGVETIVTPESDGYAVTFRSHFPTPGVALSVKAWRGPIGRA